MIAAVETEASTIEQDNAAIKAALSTSNVPIPIIDYSRLQLPEKPSSGSGTFTPSYQRTLSNSGSSPNTNYDTSDEATTAAPLPERQGQIPLDFSKPSTIPSWAQGEPATSQIRMHFDDLIESSCLHISPINTEFPDSSTELGCNLDPSQKNSADVLSQSTNLSGFATDLGSIDPFLLSAEPQNALPQPDLTIIAINFILA